MLTRRRRNERLVALSVLGTLLFNYPVLEIFNVDRLLFGLPVLFAYLFFAWAVVILFVALVIRKRADPDTRGSQIMPSQRQSR